MRSAGHRGERHEGLQIAADIIAHFELDLVIIGFHVRIIRVGRSPGETRFSWKMVRAANRRGCADGLIFRVARDGRESVVRDRRERASGGFVWVRFFR